MCVKVNLLADVDLTVSSCLWVSVNEEKSGKIEEARLSVTKELSGERGS